MLPTTLILPTSEGLRAQSRFRGLTADRLRVLDLILLVGAGIAAAAATSFLDLGRRMPGHSILQAVLPLAVGLAIVPRRGSGLVMSASAALAVLALRAGGGGPGTGAMTSLLVTGPLLDLASRWTSRGWQIYLSLAAAGLASNMIAFLVRWLTKAASGGGGGGGLGGGRALAEWQPQAIVTYAVFGLVAGLVSATICFRATAGPRDGELSR